MKALVYNGRDSLELADKPKPTIQHPTDCIVKIMKTTICGTDLHIKKGDVPTVETGRTLGHEGVGEVVEVGTAVMNFRPHDHVLISCITACGRCSYCKEKMYSHCEVGGWLLGNKIDGTQAEYVRIPYADTSLYHMPPNVDADEVVLFSDILPTGFETGVLKGKIKVADTVAIVGAGPIGLSTLLTAQLFSPSEIIVIDIDPYRLNVAKRLGATFTIDSRKEGVIEQLFSRTNQKGVDVAIEAVGIPETFALCQSIVAPGGSIANIGVHGKSVELHLEKLWNHNITITTGLVDTFSIPILLKTLMAGKLNPQPLITHHFALKDMLQAYQVFANASQEQALKVIIDSI